VSSKSLHATFHASNHPKLKVRRIGHRRDEPPASRCRQGGSAAPPAHLSGMSNHTIATPITTWAAARTTDREVLNRAKVATLLNLDPRTVDHAIADGTIPAVHVGRRVLIPRRPFLHAFGADDLVSSGLPQTEDPA
jgi:excisionase family DNA binding protein